jgi:hypothetical protein
MIRLSEMVKNQEFIKGLEGVYQSLDQNERSKVEKKILDIGEWRDQCVTYGISDVVNPSTKELYIAAMRSLGLLDELLEKSGYLE